MLLNLAGIRNKIFQLRSWASTGSIRDEQLNSSINLALNQMAMDCSDAFVPDKEVAVLYGDENPFSDAVTSVYRTADTWVLTFLDQAGAPHPLPIADDRWTPMTDGSWDGVMHLEITTEDGRVRRRQSREWWYEENLPATERTFYVTLDRAFPAGDLDSPLTARIYQPRFFTRDDVLKVQSAVTYNDNTTKMLKLAVGSAEYMQMSDHRGDRNGYPEVLIDQQHFQLDAPNYPIDAKEAENQLQWVGEEDTGDFRFLITYVWGKTDAEHRDSPGGNARDPVWESAPSPECSYEMVGLEAIDIGLPNIDWMQGFNVTGTLRDTHSGFRKRIYVARDAVSTKVLASWHPHVERGGIFYLLTEVDGDTTQFVWDGSITPDYHRRFHHSTGYYGWQVYPHQDGRYELDVRVLRKPDDMVHDQDTPPIKPDAIPAFMELCLYYAALQDGVDMDSARAHLKRYEALCDKVRASYANRGGVIAPASWNGSYGNYGRRYGQFILE